MIKNCMSLLLLGCVFFAVPASGQNEGTHKGFWLSFGGGGGWMEGERSASSYFRMGGTPNSKVHFGGQVLHWWQNDDIQHSNVSAIFSVYPFFRRSRRSGKLSELFLKTGFGIAVAHNHWQDQTGIGLDLGTGIDLRLGGNFFVTPNLDFLLDFFNESTDTSFLFTLGLSWH